MDSRQVEILLVEDSPQDAELTLRALRKCRLGDNVVVVTDGAEALDFVFARGKYSLRSAYAIPRVIILDLHLPKVSGLGVLRELKANETTRAIPVVVLTSSSEERDVAESYQLGVNSYVVKPVEFERFTAAISRLGIYWLILNRPQLSGQFT